ncbi:hypothetical protein ACOSP7_028631 [Xanthoceras sorbifolium]
MARSLRLPDANEALRRLKEMKKKATAKKAAPTAIEVEKIKTHPPPPSTGQVKTRVELPSVGQKRYREDSANEGEPLVALSFPTNASTYSNFGAILHKGRSTLKRMSRSSRNCRLSKLEKKPKELKRSFDRSLMLALLVQVLS